MEVKDINQFLADIDRFEHVKTEPVKHRGHLHILKIHLEKPITGETATTHINIRHKRDTQPPHHTQHKQRFEKTREWYELHYDPGEQKPPLNEAAIRTHNMIQQGTLKFDKTLDKPHTIHTEITSQR